MDSQFDCECGHDVEDHAEGNMGNGTRCRKCDCRRYRLIRPTKRAGDLATPSDSKVSGDNPPSA